MKCSKLVSYTVALVFCCYFTLSIQADNTTGIILQGCVKSDNQIICPSSKDYTYSESRLLYYRNNIINKTPFNRAKMLFNKGIKYENKGNLNVAKMYYYKSIEECPRFVEAHTNLGSLLLCLGEYDKAIIILNKVLELTPDYHAMVYNNLGLAYEGKKDLNNAIKYYELSINLAPEYALPRNNLATVYIKLKKYESALYELKQVNKIAPELISSSIKKYL